MTENSSFYYRKHKFLRQKTQVFITENTSFMTENTSFYYRKPVFRIRVSFHADPDPGSQKCPYGSGSGSKEVNTKEE